MGTLNRLAFATAWLWATPAEADPVNRWHEPIAEASERFSIPANWIRQVIRIESGGYAVVGGQKVVSRVGAIGLMQLMPSTWREMRARLGLGFDPAEPRDNILAGAAYLRAMYDRFGYPGLFGAYNAGPARYADFVLSGRALPPETRTYVTAVARGLRTAELTSTSSPAGHLGISRARSVELRGSLFVQLSSVGR